MRITVLMDNQSAVAGCAAEHGMSLWIETGAHRILWDAGASDGFADNAAALGVDLSGATHLMLSHGHSDHAGGMIRAMALCPAARLWMHREAGADFRLKAGFIAEDIGIPEALRHVDPKRVRPVETGLTQVAPGIWLVAGFQGPQPSVRGNRTLQAQDGDGKWKKDDFRHEMALVIQHGQEAVLISGCSHSGVLNILETVKRLLPEVPVRTLMGGFHLMGFPFQWMGEPSYRIRAMARGCIRAGIAHVWTGHCTGSRGYRILSSELGARLHPLTGGTVVE